MSGYTFDFNESDIIEVDVIKSGMQTSVVPVIFRREGISSRIEGTAFCIASLIDGQALFVTAKHVVEQLDGNEGIECFLCLPWELGEGEETRDLVGVYVEQICLAETYSDVALLAVNTNNRPNPVQHPTPLRLTMNAPPLGSRCMALGYPQSADGRKCDLLASRGIVHEIHPAKRDNTLSTFPTFRTDATYLSGMSGGPIIDNAGKVTGIVSHSIDGAEDPVGYGAVVAALAELTVHLRAADQKLTRFTFAELAQVGTFGNTGDFAMTLNRDDEGVLLTWTTGDATKPQ